MSRTDTPELSVAEKKAWAELAIWIGALLFIWMRLTAGIDLLGQSIGFAVVEQSAARTFNAYLAIGILAAIAVSSHGEIKGAKKRFGAEPVVVDTLKK